MKEQQRCLQYAWVWLTHAFSSFPSERASAHVLRSEIRLMQGLELYAHSCSGTVVTKEANQ